MQCDERKVMCIKIRTRSIYIQCISYSGEIFLVTHAEKPDFAILTSNQLWSMPLQATTEIKDD